MAKFTMSNEEKSVLINCQRVISDHILITTLLRNEFENYMRNVVYKRIGVDETKQKVEYNLIEGTIETSPIIVPSNEEIVDIKKKVKK